jgi:hypothetical protein
VPAGRLRVRIWVRNLRVDTTFNVAKTGLYNPEINRDDNPETVDSNWCTSPAVLGLGPAAIG